MMPGANSNKPSPIADKYSLDYYRRPLATRSWRSLWYWAALLLAMLIVAGMYFLEGRQTFHASPVSSAHATFGQRCELCHDRPWQTIWRLTTFSNDYHSVSDTACQRCHNAADHVPGRVTPAVCVTCHQEHRPDRRLTELTDGLCTRCHDGLTLDGQESANFWPEISHFEAGRGGHPEFAFVRDSDQHVGDVHAARDVATFVPGPDGTGHWEDRSALKFNHQVHFDPEGIMHPDGKRARMACADCHVPDVVGAYMQDINYETHCKDCHPLRFPDLAGNQITLPHASVEQVRGVLRERLALNLQGSSAERPSDSEQPPSATAIKLPKISKLPTPILLAEDEQGTLAEQLKAADHAVFGLEAKGMCRKCHELEAHEGTWRVLLSRDGIVAEADDAGEEHDRRIVPDRWMKYARFDHEKHRAVQCTDCHAAITSDETADILMPSIAACWICHTSDSSRLASPIRYDCVLCHTYHDEGDSDYHGMPLERLFTPTSMKPLLLR